jgi:hypothetical protein
VLDQDYLKNFMTKEALYRDGHAATDDFLGLGMLYYAITYMLKAKICVCLGSGGGFVPRCMRQAQRDLCLVGGRTILVDDQSGRWGQTYWDFFQANFPDVEHWKMTTAQAARKCEEIELCPDYVHIDANHDELFVKEDFANFGDLLAENGMITLHDTATVCGVPQVIRGIRANQNWEVIDLNKIGVGVAIAKKRT